MRLRVLLPTDILIDQSVKKVIAEAANGAFCLLPRHADFVAGLAPGLLSFVTADGREEFLAVDEGILVKCGADVLVSTPNAALGPDLGAVRRTVENQFRVLEDRERMARTALARLEADLVRRFIELGQHGHA